MNIDRRRNLQGCHNVGKLINCGKIQNHGDVESYIWLSIKQYNDKLKLNYPYNLLSMICVLNICIIQRFVSQVTNINELDKLTKHQTPNNENFLTK